MKTDFLAEILQTIRDTNPLVYQITNYVTVNDCANATLAVGASPVMAHSIKESADMAKLANAIVLNIGTPDDNSVAAMLNAGKAAMEKGIPIIFDPVGAGASNYRKEICEKILSELDVAIIRGNQSEFRSLLQFPTDTRGVDSINDEEDFSELAFEAAREFSCIAAVTGMFDCISDGDDNNIRIANGTELLQRLTGTGCLCTAICASCAAANPDKLFEAATTGIAITALAGEIAAEKLKKQEGTGTLHRYLFDEIYNMSPQTLQKKTRILI